MKPVTISGEVTKFQGNGRQLGYPTANVTTATDLHEGVYFGFADLASFTAKPALIFVGIPVTMGDHERRVEVHILDIPDIDYYGKTVTATLMHFHRSNQHFDGVPELIAAMHGDEAEARQWFSQNPLAKSTQVSNT